MKLEGSEFKEVEQPVDVPAVDLEKKEKAESIFKDIFSRPLGDLIDKFKEETSGNENSSPEVPSDEAPTNEKDITNPDIRNCPIENGSWEGERGNSKWVPDADYTPLKSNPEGKYWDEILASNGIDGINFTDGEPCFTEISKGNVKIENFSSNRDDNFDKADIELAKERQCSPSEVKEWRKENGYTWHECKDMETMEKVPGIIHNNVTHRGGVSNIKSTEN